MIKNFALLLLLSFLSHISFGQMPFAGGQNGASKIGHFYGKVIDSTTGKAVPYAVVELMGNKWDTASKSMKPGVIAGQVCGANGEFSLDHLPIMGKMTLKISFIGYQDCIKPASFHVDFSKIKKTSSGTPDYSGMINMVDVDLGNIPIKPATTQLQQVTIQASAPVFQLQVDKKVYNVDKDITSTGGTAQDVLKNVPSVNVDVDGNVTMRNATPQILVDGMPTTLTMDEIPADAIQNIEVITNPSAKYDASGGGGGIINIVMKKDRKAGYSSNLRAGVDERGRFNGGGNVNVRQGKINFFANAFLNERKSMAYTSTDRQNLIGSPLTNIYQNDTATNLGEFGYANAGFDFFPDVRNTFTVSETFVRGSFSPYDYLVSTTDSLKAGNPFSIYDRTSIESTTFRNWSTNVSYKHLFPKEDETFTAFASGSFIKNSSDNNFYTQYYNMSDAAVGSEEVQLENESGGTNIYTVQADFTDPITKTVKIDAGLRSSIRNYSSIDNNYLINQPDTIFLPSASNQYTYTDEVYAAYFEFSQQIKKFSYQLGLREESSFYTGTLIDSNMTFKNYYPAEFFPSAFASYQFDSKDQFQLNYSRRVNRPTFFELIPYTNYTDSLNLQRGNPDLKPEFVNNVEFNYQRNLNYTDILLVSLFLHQTNNLITSYQVPYVYLNESYILNTYENANSGLAYGLEITLTNTIGKWFTLLTDMNLYNSQINATNLGEGLTNNQLSYNARVAPTIKFPENFTLQITAMYQSQASLPVSLSNNSNSPGGGGMGYFGSPVSTVQGYTKPFEYVDVAVKKEFLKNHALSATLSCADIFRTRINATYSESPYFIQNYSRIRDPQFFRFNLAYRFGKADASLFKRKVIQNPADQMQDMSPQN
jgi:ferric enterobactin receptor